MPDTYTETTRQSYFSRLGASIKGIVGGLVLFLAGFPVLFNNEGCAVRRARALDEGEKSAISVSADEIDPANEDRLVHFAGEAVTDEVLVDEDFGISVTGRLSLIRSVEMFQWVESSRSKTTKNTGGSTTTTTTYSYERKWSDAFVDSSEFKHPEGHENPAGMPVEGKRLYGKDVHVGAFLIPGTSVRSIGEPVEIAIAPSATNAPSWLGAAATRIPSGWFASADGKSAPGNPSVGDVRVTFRSTPRSEATFVAKQTHNSIAGYMTRNGSIMLQRDGIHTMEEMFESARQANSIRTLLVRIGGFLCFFFGIAMVLKPLSVLADVIPFLGNVVGAGTGFVAFLAALVCWLATVAVAWLFYRPLVGVPLLLAAIALAVLLVRRTRHRA